MKYLSVSFILVLQLIACKTGTDHVSETTSNENETSAPVAGKDDFVAKTVKKVHNFDEFPADFVMTEIGPDCEENKYFFMPDHSLIIEDLFMEDGYETGNWEMVNDTVVMHITRQTGRRGIGEPEIPEGMEGINNCGEWPNTDYVNYDYTVVRTYSYSLKNLNDKYWFEVDTNAFASDFDQEKISYPLNGDYTFASMRLLDSLELEKYSKSELRLMRNEIFARYNYIFKSEDLRWHFGDKKWYFPRRENVDNLLTELEKKNIALIKEMEKK